MTSSVPTVFVCGATGSQGGALARQLRQLNWNVHAIVRDMASTKAVDLKAIGIHLTQGDWDDTKAISSSLAGCEKAFLCLLPNFADLGCELRQAQNILRVAKASGVNQVVASTSLGVAQLDAKVHVPPGSFMEKHLTSKKAIEQAVLDTGFDYHTFLRPAFFMANFLAPKNTRYPEIQQKGTWTTTMRPETQFPLIDHVDIARFAVAVFQSPGTFNGRAIGLASKTLTIQETLDELAKAAGRPGEFKAVFKTDDEIAAQKDSNVLVNSTSTMRSTADYVNMVGLAKMIPGGKFTSFKEFLEREMEGVRGTYC